MHYLYHLRFRDKEDDVANGIEELIFSTRMYAMADKYDVASMRKLALESWEKKETLDELLYTEYQEESDAETTRYLISLSSCYETSTRLHTIRRYGNWFCRSLTDTLQP